MRSTKSILKPLALSAMIGASSLSLTGCGYNQLQAQDETVTAAWSEVVNQYQRRDDLIDNLVEVTKKYASHEEEVFTQVAQARSQISGLNVTPEVLNDPAMLEKYQEAQANMGGALSRLMAVSENYPQLKADAIFQDLTAQLEGTENRITTARNRYIESVQTYNTTVRQFPTNLTAMVFGMDRKENFSVENEAEISTAPKVDFGDSNTAEASSSSN